MKIFIIILMFIKSVCAAATIAENGKAVKVENTVTGFRHLTAASCISIAVITTGFNAACVYLLACVV